MADGKKLPWYLAVYETNDSQAQKRCEAIVLYGMPNWNEGNPTIDSNPHGYKHLKLYCPTCNYAHEFKRQEWNAAHEFDTIGNYVKKGDANGKRR